MTDETADPRELHKQTGLAWQEAAAEYERELADRIDFLRKGGRNFCPPELPHLEGLGDWCQRAIHLQCAGGTDTLSLWNQGAHEVVGVDISSRMLGCARAKSEALDAPAEWYCSDILDTPHELDGTADLVYTGRGALCWMMDIEAWAAVAARLLRCNGRLFVFEGHPLTWIWDREASELLLDPVYGDYFQRGPIGEKGWCDEYIGDLGQDKDALQIKYEHQWNLGDVVNAVIGAGLVVERLEEHPEQFWEAFPNLPADIARRVPQTFLLIARKPAPRE
ncbi:class I SAM-dependent methyltransferase [bacterium]|nr:class I SAM-dependent methyltransferase [bacterium]